MHELILGLALAASPGGKLAVVVAPDKAYAEVAAVATKAGYRAVNGTAVYEALFSGGMLGPTLEIGQFDEPPPAGLPKAAQDDWRAGTAACKARTGMHGGREAIMDPAAHACGVALENAIWQRWIEAQGAARVLQLQAREDDTTHKWDLEARTYEPASPKATFARQHDVTLAHASSLAGFVLEGQGSSVSRPTSHDLPEAPSAAAAKGAPSPAVELPPVPAPEGCAGLPPALKVGPAGGPMVDTLASRWAASVKGKASKEEPLACSLAVTGAKTDMMGTSVDTLTAVLSCGAATYRTTEMVVVADPASPKNQDKVTAKLIQAIYKARCGK